MFSLVSQALKTEPLLRGQHLPMYCGPNEPLKNMPLPQKNAISTFYYKPLIMVIW